MRPQPSFAIVSSRKKEAENRSAIAAVAKNRIASRSGTARFSRTLATASAKFSDLLAGALSASSEVSSTWAVSAIGYPLRNNCHAVWAADIKPAPAPERCVAVLCEGKIDAYQFLKTFRDWVKNATQH